MSKLTLIQALQEDRNLIKKIAKKFIEFGDLKMVEREMNLDSGTIEEIFGEDPELADEFDSELAALVEKGLRREGAHKLFKITKILFDAIEDTTAVNDGGPSITDKIKASSILVKILEPPKLKKGDKEDGLDALLRDLEDESKERKRSKDMQTSVE